MPLYEYECEENGHRFELIRKFSDPPVKTCIKCKSKVRKLLSAPAISFKGSGWYVTDYARKGKAGTADSSSKDRSSREKGSKPDSSRDKGSKDSSGSKER